MVSLPFTMRMVSFSGLWAADRLDLPFTMLTTVSSPQDWETAASISTGYFASRASTRGVVSTSAAWSLMSS